MADELGKAIGDTVKEVAAPLVGAAKERFSGMLGRYALAWCLWNWRFLLVALALNRPPAERLKLLKPKAFWWYTELNHDAALSLWSFVLPAIAVALLLWLQPVLDSWLRKHMEEQRYADDLASLKREREHKRKVEEFYGMAIPTAEQWVEVRDALSEALSNAAKAKAQADGLDRKLADARAALEVERSVRRYYVEKWDTMSLKLNEIESCISGAASTGHINDPSGTVAALRAIAGGKEQLDLLLELSKGRFSDELRRVNQATPFAGLVSES